jgi:hypothetical protein
MIMGVVCVVLFCGSNVTVAGIGAPFGSGVGSKLARGWVGGWVFWGWVVGKWNMSAVSLGAWILRLAMGAILSLMILS